MKVTAVKTHKITTSDKDILKVLDQYIVSLKENSVVAVTSKIVSICEGRVVPMENVSKVSKGETEKDADEQKDRLIEEAEYFLPGSENKYGVSLTITNNTLVANAGIDESNGNGYYVLWPKDAQASANAIRTHLIRRCVLNNLGVIITDSKTTPLRWGVTAIAIAYCGFKPLKNYIGTKDLFGRSFVFEKLSIIDSLASAATVVMGEGAEQTPIAILEDLPGSVEFVDKNPTEEELKQLKISIDEDLYAPLLKNVKWKRGKKV